MLVKQTQLLYLSVLALKIILTRRGYALGILCRCHQATKYCFYSETEERSDKAITNGLTYSLLIASR